MAKRLVMVSDLTGNVIDDESHVTINVLDHPQLEQPVRLDVSESEIKTLTGTNTDYTILEVQRPNQQPERVVMELTKFDKLFKVDVDEALRDAEPLSQEAPRRRGRPRGSSSGSRASAAATRRDPEQLKAIRTWAREQGWEVADRGRISTEIENAYNAAN